MSNELSHSTKQTYEFGTRWYDNKQQLEQALVTREIERRASELGVDDIYIYIDPDESEVIENRVKKVVKEMASPSKTTEDYVKALKHAKALEEKEELASTKPHAPSTEETPPSASAIPEETSLNDESYENCYGLINEDVDDALSELFEKDDDNKTAADLMENTEEWDAEFCRQELAAISPLNYDESARDMFILMNYRLSCIGIAPRWRGIVRDRHLKSSKREVTEYQKAYLRDIQTFDLEWVFRRYHGHQVDETWNEIFKGIFSKESFDTRQASLIAGMSLRPAMKVEYLMLTPEMQKELFMLRTKENDRYVQSLIAKSKRVRVDLLSAAQRNRRRGSKLMQNLQRRIDLWIAANMIHGGSLISTIETFALMTGENISPSNCKRLLKTMNEALMEVESRYVLK